MQLSLFHDEQIVAQERKALTRNISRSGTFTVNMKLPIHRWFRYSAGFSAEWVERVVQERKNPDSVVLDPFAGSGTTLLAAAASGVRAYGFESHPFVTRIAKAKLRWEHVAVDDYLAKVEYLVHHTRKTTAIDIGSIPALLLKCYDVDTLTILLSWRKLFFREMNDGTPSSEMLWLTISSILRPCSFAGTAQWQYILPNKTKRRIMDPVSALRSKANEIASDIASMRKRGIGNTSVIIMQQDAREHSAIAPSSIDLVVTSPPYPNNYDYADATRLEMTFWGDIESWGDLQYAVRRNMVRSCSQHAAAERLSLDCLLENEDISPIREELTTVCRRLEAIRLTKGGRKTYHTMIAAYYSDISRVLMNLKPLCAHGATVCFVIGDSAPYGIHAPAVQWFTALAQHAGFHSARFEKLRDRNIKWKNRKHSVPLLEGRLWFRG